MNRLISKRSGTLLSTLIIFSTLSFSQLNNVDFLKSAPADGAKFIQAYVSPWANAFGSGLNGGWYNTAKPHKFGGFDVTTGISVGIVPASADKFELSSLGLSSSLTATEPTSSISGPDIDGPAMAYKAGGVTLASFKAPPGTSWKYIPVPTAQIGIGLPFGTELKARFIPKVTIQNGDISLWGVGIVHSVLQYIPGNKLMPFDVSLFGGYTKLEGNVPLGLKPDPAIPQAYTTPFNASTSFNDQNLNLEVTALNVSAIASLNLPVITFYGGLGYCKTKTAMLITGNFPTPSLVTPTLPAVPYAEYNNTGVKTGKDFPSINIENFSGLRANIGLRIKLAIITIHADYTRAQYNVFSAGLGISFR
jgi:hypothetical protein